MPGTRLRFGLDPILGLIPGLGDGIGAALAVGLMLEGARLGVSRATLLRMAVNVALDALIGAIPFLGDLFDFGFKANLRNSALLDRAVAAPARRRRADYLFVTLLAGGLLLVIAAVIGGSIWLAGWLIP